MIKQELQKYFRRLLYPIFVLLILAIGIYLISFPEWIPVNLIRRIGLVLFVLSALNALVFPLLYRLKMIRRLKRKAKATRIEFISFQKHTLEISLSTFYFLIMALFVGVSQLVYLGIFLLALYSAYFYFPSQKRVDFEIRLFRVEEK